MKVYFVDNLDSFTYNIVHYLQSYDVEVKVVRNDEVNLNEILDYDRIVLSPGPGLPKEAGGLMEVIEKYYSQKPILGVCLGHQALASFFGGELYNLSEVFHGVESVIKTNDDDCIYKNLEEEQLVGRYHSWAVRNFPERLKVSSTDENGTIMSFYHKDLPIHGVQFHPESVMTPNGKKMIENWLKY